MSDPRGAQTERDHTAHTLVPETWLLGGVPRYYWFWISIAAVVVTALSVSKSGNANTSPRENFLAYLGIGGFAFASVVFPGIANYFIPRRIELKNGKICIYHPYQFKFINTSELTQIRPPRTLEALLRLKSKSAIVLVEQGRKKTFIEPKQFKDPDLARETLVGFLRPRLRNLAARPPKSLVLYPEPYPFIMAGLLVGPVIAIRPILVLSIVSLAALLALVGVFLKSSRVVFMPDGIVLKTFRKSTLIGYEKVHTLDLRIKNGRELLTLRDQHKTDLVSFISDEFDFPHIRDFLVLQCTEAHISSDLSHKNLNLCAFESPLNELHKPPVSESLSSSSIVSESVPNPHITLGDTP